MINFERIQEYRSQTFGFHPKYRIKDKTQAISFANSRGFIYFWPITGILLPSLWGAVAGDRPVPNDHDDPAHVTWNWKDSLLGQHVWYYGKILRKKATILSMEMAPYFYALSENYGSPEEDYLTIYEQGRLTQEAKAVYEALLENSPLDSIALRKAARLTNPGSESRYNKALADLQSDFKIMPVGVVDAGAWHYAFSYDLVARHEPDLLEKSRFIGELDARQEIIARYVRSVGACQIRDLTRLLAWLPGDIQQAVDKLVAQGIVRDQQALEEKPGAWIVLPELL